MHVLIWMNDVKGMNSAARLLKFANKREKLTENILDWQNSDTGLTFHLACVSFGHEFLHISCEFMT